LQPPSSSPADPIRQGLRERLVDERRHPKLPIAVAQERLHLRVPLKTVREPDHLRPDSIRSAVLALALELLVPISKASPGPYEPVRPEPRFGPIAPFPFHGLHGAASVPGRRFVHQLPIPHERRTKIARGVGPEVIERASGGLQACRLRGAFLEAFF